MSAKKAPEEYLREIFERNGCARSPDPKQKEEKSYDEYKKGWEIRLVAKSKEELNQIQDALKQLDFEPGKPWDKLNQYVQPVYGKQEFERFKVLMGKEEL